MSSDPRLPTEQAGFDLPLLLLAGFRATVDELHAGLAERGHPDVRPMYGFVFKAIGDGTTAVELGQRLGVSKQAAGKTVEQLERLGYVERCVDPNDARCKLVRLTAHGQDLLVQATAVFTEMRARWVAEIGEEALADLERTLRAMSPHHSPLRLDIPAWFNGQ